MEPAQTEGSREDVAKEAASEVHDSCNADHFALESDEIEDAEPGSGFSVPRDSDVTSEPVTDWAAKGTTREAPEEASGAGARADPRSTLPTIKEEGSPDVASGAPSPSRSRARVGPPAAARGRRPRRLSADSEAQPGRSPREAEDVRETPEVALGPGVTEWSLYLMRQVDRLARRLDSLENELVPGAQRTALEALSLCRSQESRLRNWSENCANTINFLGEESAARRQEVQELHKFLVQVDIASLSGTCQQLAAEATAALLPRVEQQAAEQLALMAKECEARREEASHAIRALSAQATAALAETWEELASYRLAGLDVAEEGRVSSLNKTHKAAPGRSCTSVKTRTGSEHAGTEALEEDGYLEGRGPTQDEAQAIASPPVSDEGLNGALAAVEGSPSLRRQLVAEVGQVRRELEMASFGDTCSDFRAKGSLVWPEEERPATALRNLWDELLRSRGLSPSDSEDELQHAAL